VRGLLLESPVPLRLGDDLSLKLQLPGDWGEGAGTGRVVREAGAGRYGIALGVLGPTARARIEAFVQSLAGDGPASGL
jgi:hypothetical protein